MRQTMTNQELNTHAIKVIGHRNPDTDSICAAIAYSRLKNKLDPGQSLCWTTSRSPPPSCTPT